MVSKIVQFFMLVLLVLIFIILYKQYTAIPILEGKVIETSFTQILLPTQLIKLIIIPVFIWIMKLIVVEAVARYHLIRHLYYEIMRNHALFSGVKKDLPKWATDNIDGIKEPALMERLTWNKFLHTNVYDCSQTNIVKSLWFKEIPNIHELYSNFIELHRLLISVATEINVAKHEYIYGTPVEGDNVNELLVSIKKHNTALISDKVDAIKILLGKVCKEENGKDCAREQFYSIHFYLIPLIFLLLFGGIGALLFIQLVQ